MPILRPRVVGGDVKMAADAVSIGAKKRDDLATAMTKWIPVEVIACYQAVAAALGNSVSSWLPFVIPVGMLVTFGWIAFSTEEKQAKSAAARKAKSGQEKATRAIAWRQAVVSSVAFGFWAAGSTSADIWKLIEPGWNPGFNPALFAVGGLLLPICDGMLRYFGVPQD